MRTEEKGKEGKSVEKEKEKPARASLAGEKKAATGFPY